MGLRGSKGYGGIATAAADGAARSAAPRRRFAAAAEQVLAHTLPNGLTVLVWSDRNIPSIALHNWVHVGSRNEGAGTSGLAHFF